MSALREWAARLRAFVTRSHPGGVEDELRFHLEMAERRLIDSGVDHVEARRQARLELGGVPQIAEAYADQRSLPAGETIVQDVRYAIRILRRSPGLTAAALLTLALGIGASAAIFSIVNAVLLRPLPYADPGRLVVVGDRNDDGSAATIGFTTFQDLREASRTFESMAAIRSWDPTLVTSGEAERVAGLRVSWNYFELLGVQPALGRGFAREDDRQDGWRVVILSDGLWRRRFDADPNVVGRTITMNDRQYRVIGVLPRGYEPLVSQHFYQPAEIWAALGYDSSLSYACRSCQHLRAIGRLRAGASRPQAVADLTAIRARLRQQFPGDYPPGEMAVVPLQDAIAGPARLALYVLFGAVGFVLLIACANVANLLLARSMVRAREMALRGALGAGPGRLVRQLLTESVTLGVAGGALGVGLAMLGLRGVTALAPESIPRLEHAAVDARVLAFAAAVSILTSVLFGLVPAFRITSFSRQPSLSANSRTAAGRSSRRASDLLVIADLALALVLLAGAGLMLRTVERLMHVDPGFDPRGVMALSVSLGGQRYADDGRRVSFMDSLLERVAAIPGVRSAAVAGQIPLGGNFDTWGFHVEGRIKANPSEDPSAQRYAVTPGYFKTLGIPLVRGRLFTESDRAEAMPVLVISETAAARVFPNEDPLGHRVRIGDAQSGPWRTIVGVVGDVRHLNLVEAIEPQMYAPQAQMTDSQLVLVVRSAAGSAESLMPSIRHAVGDLDPAIPIFDAATMETLVAASMADRRFVMRLLGGFAGVALLLAAIGLYGVVSYSVAERTRELGVRVALGARPSDILRLVLSSGLPTIGAGLVAGLCAAAVLMQSLGALLVGVGAVDPATFAAAAGILVLVAALAHFVPVRRALAVDPAIALRQE